jgi:hypothetical protein
MQRTRTALAAMLDFRESSTAAAVTDQRRPLTADASARLATSAALTMAPRSAARDGSQKYHELDLRRRRAQIRARRTLGLL